MAAHHPEAFAARNHYLMFQKIPFCSIIASAILFLSFSIPGYAEAETWHDVTVITTSGWEYEGITVQYESGNTYIKLIKADGASRKIDISGIQMIVDSNGVDITDRIIPAGDTRSYGESEQKESTLDERPEIPVRESESRFGRNSDDDKEERRKRGKSSSLNRYRFALVGGAGTSKEVGSWFEGLSSGFTYDLKGILAVTRDLHYIGFNFRFQSMGFEEGSQEIITYCDYDQFGMYVCTDYIDEYALSLREYYLVFGQVSPTVSDQHLFGYVEMGLGIIDHHAEITLRNDPYVETDSSDEYKFAVSITMGGTWPVTRNIGLNLETKMRITGSGSWNPYTIGVDPRESKGALFAIRLGIMTMFGN